MMLVLVAIGLVAGRATADDAKTIVEKAIKAHGGEEKLTKFKATKLKAKGTMSLMGADIEFSVEATTQLPDQFREEVKLEVMGQSFSIVQVYDGKKGWASNPMGTMELDGAQLDELKEQAYGNYVESLVPLLKDKQFELKLIGEEKIDEKPAVGVKVTAKGHKEIKIFFDKETSLMVKTESKTLDPAMQEVNSETIYSNYKDVNGLKQAMKILVKHEGKKFMEGEVTEIKVLEKVDASTFAKP
jgi:hypothetical protein